MSELESDDPYLLFKGWMAEAEVKELNDPNAMALATVGADGMPSLRMVLLKDYNQDGFVFFTNLNSRKGGELQNHPKAALLFHWKSLRRQVRVEGLVEAVSHQEADQYFDTRPRLSQIGAWASKQSQPLQGRFQLEAEVARYTLEFGIGKVSRPAHWSGFRIVPTAFEFWQDGAFRMHDRWRFEPDNLSDVKHGRKPNGKQAWQINRLFP